ncbi:hypothetical protein M758_8G193000 [Ceratodon purpureus]|nr:hypothetical protein M758_8G193000 [Ceratodon purpureus]
MCRSSSRRIVISLSSSCTFLFFSFLQLVSGEWSPAGFGSQVLECAVGGLMLEFRTGGRW